MGFGWSCLQSGSMRGPGETVRARIVHGGRVVRAIVVNAGASAPLPEIAKEVVINVSFGIAAKRESSVLFLVVIRLVVVLIPGAHSETMEKNRAPKRDGLAEYVQRVSARLPTLRHNAGKLWNDSGRLANMVADYKASRVGDLVTISVAQNLSATSAGNVSTNRTFSANSGITALPGQLKTTGVANLFRRTRPRCCPERPGHFSDVVEHDADRARGCGIADRHAGRRGGAPDHHEQPA